VTYAAEPPVSAYLRDLARALGDTEPRERAAVIGSVCDHIDDAAAQLGHAPTSEDLEAIVAGLGPADAVAASWSHRDDAQPEAEPVPARPRRSITDRPVGVVLVALVGIALGLALLPLSAALGWGSPATMLFVAIVSYLRWHKDEERHRAGWRTLFVATLPALVVTAFVMVAAAMATVADSAGS
jgi:hypothetical protein